MVNIGEDINLAANLLKEGKLVAIPTETVYGLAANGLDTDAIIKIYQAKNRPLFDPLILHSNSIQKIENLADLSNPLARKLAETFWPGPLTLVLPRKKIIPDLITSGLETVAVRIPRHPLTLKLLSVLEFPLAAPSANPFGYISPTTAQHVAAQLGDKVDYILDGGACSVGLESTIIGFENEQPVIYRLGGLAVEAIEKITGKISINRNLSSNPKAPGMLKTHYAPRKPLLIGDIAKLLEENNHKKCGVLSFSETFTGNNVLAMELLSTQKDYAEAARNLFSKMRLLDESEAELILTEFLPEDFLGKAINDRLIRAAAK